MLDKCRELGQRFQIPARPLLLAAQGLMPGVGENWLAIWLPPFIRSSSPTLSFQCCLARESNLLITGRSQLAAMCRVREHPEPSMDEMSCCSRLAATHGCAGQPSGCLHNSMRFLRHPVRPRFALPGVVEHSRCACVTQGSLGLCFRASPAVRPQGPFQMQACPCASHHQASCAADVLK